MINFRLQNSVLHDTTGSRNYDRSSPVRDIGSCTDYGQSTLQSSSVESSSLHLPSFVRDASWCPNLDDICIG